MSQKELTLVAEAALRWSQRVSGERAARPETLSALAERIAGLVRERRPQGLTPRLAWEGLHLHALLSRAIGAPRN
jgi:hypothetical protein